MQASGRAAPGSLEARCGPSPPGQPCRGGWGAWTHHLASPLCSLIASGARPLAVDSPGVSVIGGCGTEGGGGVVLAPKFSQAWPRRPAGREGLWERPGRSICATHTCQRPEGPLRGSEGATACCLCWGVAGGRLGAAGNAGRRCSHDPQLPGRKGEAFGHKRRRSRSSSPCSLPHPLPRIPRAPRRVLRRPRCTWAPPPPFQRRAPPACSLLGPCRPSAPPAHLPGA